MPVCAADDEGQQAIKEAIKVLETQKAKAKEKAAQDRIGEAIVALQ